MKNNILKLISLFVLAILLTGCGASEEKKNETKKEAEYTPEKLSDNIEHETATTKAGSLIVFATNKNDEIIDLNVEVEFYDEEGTLIGSDENYLTAIPKDQEVVLEMYNTPEEYAEVKVYTDAEKSDSTCFIDDIEMTDNDNGEEIIVQAKNNSEEELDVISVAIVYYDEEGEVVGFDDSLEVDVKSGRSANLTFYYPYDSNYDDIKFDSYKLFINEASKY